MSYARRAFTLIELLVVISIVALLVSILLPVLSQSRMMADTIDCATRMKASAYAMLLYVNDNKEVWPTQYGPQLAPDASCWSGGQEYRTTIAKYLGLWDSMNGFVDYNSGNYAKNPMLCKASDALGREPYAVYWATANATDVWTDMCVLGSPVFSAFQINPYLGSIDTYYHTRKGFPRDPSKALMLADGYREPRPNYWYVADGKSMFRFRHFESGQRTNDGRLNMAYIDGHVQQWQFEVGGPLWPTTGDGLWTKQEGFYWWNRDRELMESWQGAPAFPYF